MTTVNRRKVLLCLALCASSPIVTETGETTSLTVPVQDHVSISDNQGAVHMLVSFAMPNSLHGKKILYAKLTLSIDADTCLDLLNEVTALPLSKAWSSESVDWENPWDSAGGDFVVSLARGVDLQHEPPGDTEILLTDIVQAWADGTIANHGIALVPRLGDCLYTLPQRAHFPEPGYGKLLVKYMARD